MLGLLIASFLCYFIGFIGPFAFVGNFINFINFNVGVICLALTVTLDYLVDFIPPEGIRPAKISNTQIIDES